MNPAPRPAPSVAVQPVAEPAAPGSRAETRAALARDAAPELLAALYLIATDPSAIYSGANAHIGNIARAAIAKATGGNAS